MALTVPDVGENTMLDMILKDASPNAQELHLYSAISPAISETTVVANFTEATFTGYALITLVRATWNAASGGTSTYPQQSWSPTSSETIIGYWVEEVTGGEVMWVEPFTASRALNNGDTLNLDLSISLA